MFQVQLKTSLSSNGMAQLSQDLFFHEFGATYAVDSPWCHKDHGPVFLKAFYMLELPTSWTGRLSRAGELLGKSLGFDSNRPGPEPSVLIKIMGT